MVPRIVGRLAVLSLLALAPVAAGCGGGAPAKGDISFLVFGDPEEL
jgi:hypothetical protein